MSLLIIICFARDTAISERNEINEPHFAQGEAEQVKTITNNVILGGETHHIQAIKQCSVNRLIY